MSTRKSNMELLRIVAMLLVMVLHATFETMHYPNSFLVRAEPFSWLGIIFTNQLSICCVDVFVLITGWFGAHFKLQNIFRLLFQVGFVSLIVTAAFTLVRGEVPGSFLRIAQTLYGYWFINSYLVLYLFTPVLNSFAEQNGEQVLRRFLQLLLVFAIPASFFLSDFNRGFSAVSFFGLYLLGRYLRLHLVPKLTSVPTKRFLQIFLGNVAVWSLVYWLYFWLKPVTYPNPTSFMTAYTNPFTLLNACCLLLFFSRLNFSNRAVNLLAAGSLTAYLTHQQVFVRPLYFELIRYLDARFSTPLFVMVTSLSIAVIFVLSVGLDYIRQWIWHIVIHIWNKIQANL